MINTVNNVNISTNNNTAATKGKRIGTKAGIGVGGLYILKNKKDIFINGTKDAVEKLGSKGAGYAIAGGVSAAVLAGTAVAGRVIGGLIGKVIDNHNQKKAEKQLNDALVACLTKQISEETPVSVDELEALCEDGEDAVVEGVEVDNEAAEDADSEQ